MNEERKSRRLTSGGGFPSVPHISGRGLSNIYGGTSRTSRYYQGASIYGTFSWKRMEVRASLLLLYGSACKPGPLLSKRMQAWLA